MTESKVNKIGESDLAREDRFSGPRAALIRPRHLLYLALIVVSCLLGASLLFVKEHYIFAVVLASIFAFIIYYYPIVGLILFIILSFIRPGDIIPSLTALPMAKVVGGWTFLAVILQHLRNRDYLYNYRQTYLLIAFTLIIMASIPFSFWGDRSFEIFKEMIKIVIFYLIFINIVRGLKSLQSVILWTIVCIIVLCFSTIQSTFMGQARGAAVIGAGIFGDANDVALVFVTALPLAGFWRLKNPSAKWRTLLYLSTVAFFTVGVIVTQSRGGLLGLVAVLFLLFMSMKRKIFGLAAMALFGIVLIAMMPADLMERYRTIGSYSRDASAMGRIYAWRAGLNMMLDRPLNGVGIGCFEVAFGSEYTPEGFGSNRWISPHNTLVQVGAETGFVGLGLFLYLLGFCYLQLKRLKPRGSPEDKDKITKIRSMLMTSFVGFFVCAFFLTQALNYMLYILIASTVSLNYVNSRLKEEADVTPVARVTGQSY